jgi:hypothetical protein
MKRTTKYVALDVHQATTLASVRVESGWVITRAYRNLVEDSTRVMLRLKALFRARGITTPGKGVYHPRNRAQWLARLVDRGAQFRAQALYAELDVLRELRPKAKAAMLEKFLDGQLGTGPNRKAVA